MKTEVVNVVVINNADTVVDSIYAWTWISGDKEAEAAAIKAAENKFGELTDLQDKDLEDAFSDGVGDHASMDQTVCLTWPLIKNFG